jgi:hypothetical protein
MFKNLFKKNPFVYNRSAAARVLKISHNLIIRFEEWANCVFLIIKGQRPRFWTKKDYKEAFVQFRKESSKYYEVAAKSDSTFEVWNNKSSYKLEALQETIQCPCDDYANQQRIFKGHGCCKHGYAVLHFLGFDRLSEYIKNHEWLSNQNSEFIDDDDDDGWDEKSDYYEYQKYH